MVMQVVIHVLLQKNLLSKNYLYAVDDFRYEDQYYGEYLDVGQETVWYRGIPIWGMTYRGGIHKEYDIDKEEAFDFLKIALQNPEKHFPTRGPHWNIDGAYRYLNVPEGDILAFSGKEFVFKHEQEICFRSYLGGIIYDKFNRNMLITK